MPQTAKKHYICTCPEYIRLASQDDLGLSEAFPCAKQVPGQTTVLFDGDKEGNVLLEDVCAVDIDGGLGSLAKMPVHTQKVMLSGYWPEEDGRW